MVYSSNTLFNIQKISCGISQYKETLKIYYYLNMQKIHVKNETLTFWCIRKRRKLSQNDKEHSWKKKHTKTKIIFNTKD